MNKAYFLAWLKAAAIRAAKTFAQTAASLITVGALLSEINWRMVVSASAVAFVYSLLTSVAGLPEVSGTTSGTTSGNMEAVPEVSGTTSGTTSGNMEAVPEVGDKTEGE